MRKIGLFFIMGLCLLAANAGADVLQVATLNYPPFQYQEDGETKGLAADIVAEVFKRMHQEIKIRFYPFPRALRNIQDGESDVIFTFYHKKEREEFADYSTETLIDQTVSLFVLQDSPIVFDGSLSKLAPYTFGLVRFSYGSVFDEAVKNNVITQLEYVSEMEINMRKFLKKRFDILPSDRCVALYYYSKIASKEGGTIHIKELTPAIQTFPAYIGFSKKKKLAATRDKVDAVLREMKKDGSYQTIIDTHMKSWGIDLK